MNDSPPSMGSRGARFTSVMLWVFLLPGAASACPLCNSETGQQVRAGIFGGDFWPTLFMVLLPFPILLGLLVALHFGLTRLNNRSSSQNPN